MNTAFFELTNKEREMILEVMKNNRKQTYTPERLCDLQKIVDTQYFYWWMNDIKKEEYASEIFEEDLDCYYSGVGEYKSTPLNWGKDAKFCNSFINSAHMGHQPLVWFMDDTHARGIFFFESNMNYLDNRELYEHFFVYLHDFAKHEDGRWMISAYRLIPIKTHGAIRPETLSAPKEYVFPAWETI